jgi:NDP-sugar pyrophosphorylase family protein
MSAEVDPRPPQPSRPTAAELTACTPPPVCILAGGHGKRLGERVRDIPKPLLEVGGEPFLMHQLRLLASHGIKEVVLCVGYLAEQIVSAIGSERFGMNIRYSHDRPGLDGTLGAIRRALPLLGGRFLVLYGDTYLRIDYLRAAARWRASGLPAMMSVYRNDGQWGSSNALYAHERVLAYDKWAHQPDMHWIDYGLGGLQPKALELVGTSTTDLASLYRVLARHRLLYGFQATKRFYDIGTPAALAESDTYLRAHVASSQCQEQLGTQRGDHVPSRGARTL